MARRLGKALVETIGITDVDLLDVARALGSPALLHEVKVAVIPDLPEVKYP